MGLGKTIEVASLILTSPAPAGQCKCNLIITPRSISRQWLNELKEKAPGLRVLVYMGCRGDNDPPSLKEFATYDVCLCTYEVFQKEIHYTEHRDFAFQCRP